MSHFNIHSAFLIKKKHSNSTSLNAFSLLKIVTKPTLAVENITPLFKLHNKPNTVLR